MPFFAIHHSFRSNAENFVVVVDVAVYYFVVVVLDISGCLFFWCSCNTDTHTELDWIPEQNQQNRILCDGVLSCVFCCCNVYFKHIHNNRITLILFRELVLAYKTLFYSHSTVRTLLFLFCTFLLLLCSVAKIPGRFLMLFLSLSISLLLSSVCALFTHTVKIIWDGAESKKKLQQGEECEKEKEYYVNVEKQVFHRRHFQHFAR